MSSAGLEHMGARRTPGAAYLSSSFDKNQTCRPIMVCVPCSASMAVAPPALTTPAGPIRYFSTSIPCGSYSSVWPEPRFSWGPKVIMMGAESVPEGLKNIDLDYSAHPPFL